ncbi:MAG: hypothetical protein IKV50_08895 [Clostridia bacterium]|nr:hypothetical protein [Clostridia bacterium]
MLFSMLLPIACYFIALVTAPLEFWICGLLFASSLVNSCWLFQFCEEEWLELKPSFFAVPTFTTLGAGLCWTGSYFISHLYKGEGSLLHPAVVFCLCLTASVSLPYIIGLIVRRFKDHGLFIPSYQPPSLLVKILYSIVIATPLVGVLTFLLIEIGYISAGISNSSISSLATPMNVLKTELRIFVILYFAGLPLGLLGRFLFKKQSKPKETPFTYNV